MCFSTAPIRPNSLARLALSAAVRFRRRWNPAGRGDQGSAMAVAGRGEGSGQVVADQQ